MAIVLWLVLLEGLYVRALRVLHGRGVAVPRWQVAAWHASMALWIAGLLSPIDDLGDDGLSFHMLQHLLIADLAAPLMLVGLRNPVLAFFLPRPVLVPLARTHWLRATFRLLRRPLVALAIYAVVLYGWHFAVFFEAAVRHPLVHALQHASFIAIGVLVWWSALEPKRRRLRGELWKIGHILTRPLHRHVPGDELRAHPPARLHGRLRRRRARAGAEPARRPAAGRRHDGRARHPHHGVRARVLLPARGPAVRLRRAARRGAAHGALT